MEEAKNMKKAQVELKKQINDLQQSVTKKKQIAGYARERELEDMVKVALRQNKKVADKVDYLMDTLIEASQTDSEEVVEKSLQALSKSQLELMKQVETLKDKVESADTVKHLMKAQQDSLTALNAKMEGLEKIVSDLPYSSQLESVKKEINGLNEELRTLESLVMAAPEQVSSSLEMIKDDVEALRAKLDLVSVEIEKSEEDDALISNKLGVIDSLNAKITSVEGKIENLDELMKSGRVHQEEFIKSQIMKIEEDLKAIEGLKSKVDSITSISSAEKEKTLEIMGEIKKLEKDVSKIRSWVETYPISEAQETSFLNEKFSDLSAQIMSLQREDFKESLLQQTKELKKEIDGIEKLMSQGKKKEKSREIEELSASIKSLEERLKESKENSVLKIELDSLHSEIKELNDKLGNSEKASEEIKTVQKRITGLEEILKNQVFCRRNEAEEIQKHVSEARQSIEKEGTPHPEKVSNLKYLVEEIQVPEVISDEELEKARQSLEQASEKAKGQEKKKIEEIIDRMEFLSKQSLQNEKNSFLMKLKAKEISKGASEVMINDEQMLRDYIRKLPVGIELFVSDVASQLNMPPKTVLNALERIKADDGSIDLKNTGLSARLSGGRMSFVKKK